MKKQLKSEVVGGVTTFLTMAYILIVNPSILSTEGTGMVFSGVLTATVLLSFLMTLLMGSYAKLPFAVAPGMGINAFFAYTLMLGKKIEWPVALALVFWAGVLFLILSILPVRLRIVKAIPLGLRQASAVGIGFFLCFIGLKNAGLVVSDPATFVRLGNMDKTALLSLVGFSLMIFFLRRKNPFAFLIGIITVTLAAIYLGLVNFPTRPFSFPDFHSHFFKLDIWGALKLSLVPAIFSICFTDFFDSVSTFVGVSQATGMLDKDGNPINLKKGLIVDSLATLFAGLFGSSSGTAFIESIAGIEAGGRTGKSAIVTSLCFLPCFFLAPLAAMVPPYATAPVLIIVGALMFRQVVELPLREWEDLIPVFLTIVLIPLTFSIAQGMLWGFISHVVLYLMAGRRKEMDPIMYFVAALSVVLLGLEHL